MVLRLDGFLVIVIDINVNDIIVYVTALDGL